MTAGAFKLISQAACRIGLSGCFLPMQTLKRQAAKGPTGREFLDVMRVFKREAEAINIKEGLDEPIYSFDNAPIHDMALLETIGIQGTDRAPLPARSPLICTR